MRDGRIVVAVPPHSLYPLVDRLLGGRLHEILGEQIAAGQSFERIARWLAIEHDVDVTGETVRRWWREGAPVDEVAS